MLWVMMFLMLPMNTKSVRAADVSVDDTDAAQEPDFDVAAKYRRGGG